MNKEMTPTTILDLSNGLGYEMMYHPVIGKLPLKHFPLLTRASPFQKKKLKKLLY